MYVSTHGYPRSWWARACGSAPTGSPPLDPPTWCQYGSRPSSHPPAAPVGSPAPRLASCSAPFRWTPPRHLGIAGCLWRQGGHPLPENNEINARIVILNWGTVWIRWEGACDISWDAVFFCINVMYNVKNIEWFYLKYPFHTALCDITCHVKAATAATTATRLLGVWINRLQNHIRHHFFCSTSLSRSWWYITRDFTTLLWRWLFQLLGQAVREMESSHF